MKESLKESLKEKQRRLEEILAGMGSVAVAYSSGVDSTFLLKTAHDVLGGRAVALTARSCIFPARESAEALEFCRDRGIEQIMAEARPLEIAGFRDNPPERCYLCKKALFTRFLELARERGIPWVAEGSNTDDLGDYRPGLAAVAELGVRSPLREAGLGKAEIRELSRALGLPTWDKPSFACLASRFAYGETITAEKLAMVERAEQRLLELGFRQFRVRVHGNLARIEVLPEEMERLFSLAETLHGEFRALGFLYVTADLAGFRSGSMNLALGERASENRAAESDEAASPGAAKDSLPVSGSESREALS